MSKKGFDFNLEIENVKDDEKFNNEIMINYNNTLERTL